MFESVFDLNRSSLLLLILVFVCWIESLKGSIAMLKAFLMTQVI